MIEAFIDRFAFRRDGLIGAALLRVALAGIMLVGYLWLWPVRSAVLGDMGQMSNAQYLRLSMNEPYALYRYAHTSIATDALLLVSIAIAVAFAIGFIPRVTSWLFVLTAYSTVNRGFLDGDGGRILLLLMAVLLCFADSSRYLTLFPGRSLRLAWLRVLGTMVHNSASFLIRWQVCAVYAWAVFYKLGGSQWRGGTAMAYVFQTSHFAWFPSVSAALAHNAVLVALMTYGTLVFQGAFPFLMWNERIKPYLVAIACALHLTIAVTMGLLSFSATMIVCDLAVLSDVHFLKFFAFCRGLVLRVPLAAKPLNVIHSTEVTNH